MIEFYIGIGTADEYVHTGTCSQGRDEFTGSGKVAVTGALYCVKNFHSLFQVAATKNSCINRS